MPRPNRKFTESKKAPKGTRQVVRGGVLEVDGKTVDARPTRPESKSGGKGPSGPPRKTRKVKVQRVRGKEIETVRSLAPEPSVFDKAISGVAGVAKSAARDVITTSYAGQRGGTKAAVAEAIDRPVEIGRKTVRGASDLALGPNLTKAILGEGDIDSKWLAAEIALLPSNLFAPLRSVTVGTRALRGARATGKATKAVLSGEELKTAGKIIKEESTRPILRVKPRRRKLEGNVQEIAAARARTGRVIEGGIDRARPTLSRLPGVKTPEEIWARDAERGIVFESKRKALPGVLADRSIKRLNRDQKYALYAVGNETSPRQFAEFYARQIELEDDPVKRSAMEIHRANFARAARYVEEHGDGTLSFVGSQKDMEKLGRAYDHLSKSAKAREEILSQGGYLDPDTIINRRGAVGRVVRGARWTPEEEIAQRTVQGTPSRQQLKEQMLASGVDPEAVEAQLNILDTQARAAWETLVRNNKRREEYLRRQLDTLAAKEDEGEDVAFEVEQIQDELRELAAVREEGIPYDLLYQRLALSRYGFPEVIQQAIRGQWEGAPFNFQQTERLFDMPGSEKAKAVSAVTREALQAKHQGNLPDQIDSSSIASEIIASGMKLPPELRDQAALQARIDEIYENVKAGTDGRFWYDTARRVAADIAARHEGLTFDQVAQVIAIYSQAADTVANMSFVREAIEQFFEHGEIYAGRFPERQSEEAMRVLRGESWEGRKRSSFYRNIVSDDDDAVTVDRWVTRWFTPDKETPDQFYDAYEAVLQRMAGQLGWRPKEVQAAAWVTSKKLDLAKRRPKWTVDQIDRAGSDAYDVGFERYFGEQGQLTKGGRIHPNAKRVANLARKPDGGGTLYKDLRSDNAKSGYAVSHGAHEQVVPVGRVDANLIDAFRNIHLDRLKSDRNLRLGIWHNPENSRVYFDLSRKFRNREEALAFAREQGQTHIWDFRRGESIPTGLTEDKANRIKVALRDEAYGPRTPLPAVPGAKPTPNPSSPTELWDRILEMIAVSQGFTSKTGKITKSSISNAEAYIEDFVRRNPEHSESVALKRLWEMMYHEQKGREPEINFSAVGLGDLEGLPTNVKMGGQPLTVGHSPELRSLADRYMEEAGLPYSPPRTYAKVDEARAKRVADEYEQMLDINDPRATPEYREAVYRSYRAFADETMAQYRALEGEGYTFEFYPEGADPYPLGPRQAIEDLKQNRHLYVFPTDEGFGAGGAAASDVHPLLEQTDVTWAGKPTTVNDIFRAVHDVFGHGKEGVGFRADGEENAWRSHVAMYSDEAKGAMTSETRGQNSWVNFGPHGEANRNASQADTVYAEQKAGLMPEWTWREGADDDTGRLVGGSGREGRDAGERDLLERSESGAAPGPADRSTGQGPQGGARGTAIRRTNDENLASWRGELEPDARVNLVHGAHVNLGDAGSGVFVSENTLHPAETWTHELAHFWQDHFPGAMAKLERLLGTSKEDWVESYMEYVLDLYPQRSIPLSVRNEFDKLSAAILKEAEETGGVFVRQGMPRELAEFFDTTLWYKQLTGGRLYGEEGFKGKMYVATERGFPVSLRHPLASVRQRMQSLSGLFQGKTGIKGTYKDPTVKKHFTGESVLSGWIKIANLGKANYNSLLRAIRMDNVREARKVLLEASTERPQAADDIAIFVNPSDKAPAELKRFWETVEQMGKGIEVNKLSLKELDDLDHLDEDLLETAFPSHIEGKGSVVIAREIMDGLREPIEGIRWVPSKAFHASELFSAPSAFYARQNNWGRMEAIGMTVDMANDLMKLSLLPLNPAYAPMNLAGNLMLNLLQQGPFALMNLPRAAMLSRELGPDVATAVDYYMGRGIMHLGDTEIIGRNFSATVSNWMGAIVDVVPRRAAFLHEAWAMGFRSGDDIEQLLANPVFKDELKEIVERANDAIVDYERLSSFERKYLQRILFIYPWIRGATRYTYRFPAEHPAQALAFAFLYERQQAMADEELGERPWYAKFNIPIGEVERFGQTYPLVLNPKQLLPFTTPYDVGHWLAGWVTGSDTSQAPVEALQPFWPALITSITGYDTFEKNEVGRGPMTFLREAADFPLRSAIENVGKSEEELEDAASNRLYPRNKGDEIKKALLGSLSPTPYNPEKGQHYAAGKRGPTPEENAREKLEEIEGFFPPEQRDEIEAALASKVEFEHLKDEKRRELGTDDLTDEQIAEVMVDLAISKFPQYAGERESVVKQINSSTAGTIRSRMETLLGWNAIDAATRRANEKKRADAAKAEGAVVSAG